MAQNRMSVDTSSLGFPSAEYIQYNLQSLGNYARLNGGKVRIPSVAPLKKLPWVSMVIHVYDDGFYEVRLIPEEEFRAEKSLTSGVVGKPAVGE